MRRGGAAGEPAAQERQASRRRRRGRDEQIALGPVAPEDAQARELLLGLDTLCGDDHAERVGHVDGRGDDGGVGRAGAEPHRERAVDLELVEREAPQVGERRAAGAEVVDREAHAEILESLEVLGGDVDLVEQRALGDVDAEHLGRDAVLAESARDDLREVGPLQLAGRHVGADGDAVALGVLVARAQHVLARPCEHPFADRHDHAGLLGNLEEVTGRHQPAHRVLPT